MTAFLNSSLQRAAKLQLFVIIPGDYLRLGSVKVILKCPGEKKTPCHQQWWLLGIQNISGRLCLVQRGFFYLGKIQKHKYRNDNVDV